MPATLTNWKPYTQQVDNSDQQDGLFASGAFTMIAAGPPRLSAIGGAAIAAAAVGTSSPLAQWAIPIGLVQNFQLGQNKQFSRFWELGSDRSYFIAGRTVAQAGFSRVMYHGPSLLRMMYAFYEDDIPSTLVDAFGTAAFEGGALMGAGVLAGSINPHNVQIPPGYENIYLNLGSDLFSQPCGVLIYLKDSNEQTLGAVYLEETYLPSHSIATDAQGVVIQEQVTLQPERVVPVALAAVSLFDEAGGGGASLTTPQVLTG